LCIKSGHFRSFTGWGNPLKRWQHCCGARRRWLFIYQENSSSFCM